ncbi:unnamed protein product [Hapterophycus canaliculatus]
MESLPSKMREADQHLDRLGGILRSLIAPPSEQVPTPTTLRRLKQGKPQKEHQDPHQDRRKQFQQKQQQQQRRQEQEEHERQGQEQGCEQDERWFVRVSGSSSLSSQSRSRRAPQYSQPETTTSPTIHCDRYRNHRQQHHCCVAAASPGGCLINKPEIDFVPAEEQSDRLAHRRPVERAAVHDEAPTPKDQRAGDVDSDDPPRAAAADAESVPPAHCTGVDTDASIAAAAVAGATSSIQEKVSSSSSSLSLRRRVIRTWWRGLSSGVCFAAGAWAREGHGLFGAALALTAMVLVEFIDTS